MDPMVTPGPLSAAAPVAFVASSDLDRSRAFYADGLGLEVVARDDYACVLRSGTTTLRITRVDEVSVAPYTVLGWAVADIAAVVDGLERLGVATIRYDGMGQDEHGVWAAPGGDLVTWFRDPDGHVLSLTQPAG
jgi:catechol 2,3-dioxygenase-like lactoylglutathione lyase family enzyme